MPYAPRRRLATALGALTCVTLTACASTDEPPTPPASHERISTVYELPGDHVYPEGIAADLRTGDSYVGSYTTGAVYRAAPGAQRAEVFLPEGTDGRKTANGLKVDPNGRLWVIDSTAGVDVYDIATHALIARFEVAGPGPRMVNDLVITGDGTAYLTDSLRGVVYRVTPGQLADTAAHGGTSPLTTYFDMDAMIEPHTPDTYTLNGIVADPDGRYLLIVDSHGGGLYRAALTPDTPDPIRRVAVRGGDLDKGDGLELHDSTLWVAQNLSNTISRWTIGDDGATATLNAHVTDESLSIPTTLTRLNDRTLVVASQFDRGGPMGPGTPTTPFAILAVDGI